MSALAFLTPDAQASSLARTPMDRFARDAGARFEVRDGWNVAVSFGGPAVEADLLRETVAFADRSRLVKLELQAGAGALKQVVSEVGGTTLEPGLAARGADGPWWCPVTPERVLVLTEPAGGVRLRGAITAALHSAGARVTVVDVSCGLAAMTLAGPGAAELLARFCALDVRPAATPVAGFRPGSIARTPGYLLREREDELLVLVGWALGGYLCEVVADAAAPLGGGPVGAEALASHRGQPDA